MAKAIAKVFLAPILAAGLGLVLAPPARAQSSFDIYYGPPPPQWRQPYVEQFYPARRHYHSRHHVRHRARRRERTRRETAWDPKTAKGPFQIVVAIGPQEILLYGQSGLLGRATISTGRPGRPTPKGVFTVLSKSRWHRSNIYSGAPMPWMQRITWSGVAMHEGPRPGYPASHGCIRLPGAFAIRMFHTTKVGTRVVVTRDAVAPVPISSPKLFVPKESEERPVAEATAVVVADAGTARGAMTLAARSSGVRASDIESSADKSSEARDTKDAKPSAAVSSEAKDPSDAASSDPPSLTGSSDPKSSETQASDTEAAGNTRSDPKPAADMPATDAMPTGVASPAVPSIIRLPPAVPASLAKKRNVPVSVFVSRKQMKVFVRQGFHELFDMPATIADPDRPIGTHVYTAMGPTKDGKAMRWTVMSIPSSYRRHRSRRHRHRKHKDAARATVTPSTAAEALDRITLPPKAIQSIDEMLTTGSSLIVSDNALSDETDDSTNFIVLTR